MEKAEIGWRAGSRAVWGLRVFCKGRMMVTGHDHHTDCSMMVTDHDHHTANQYDGRDSCVVTIIYCFAPKWSPPVTIIDRATARRLQVMGRVAHWRSMMVRRYET